MDNENLEMQEQNIDVGTEEQGKQDFSDLGNDGAVEQEERKINFNPDDVEFEDNYNFTGYDLSKFKENLNLNEESVKVLDGMTAKYNELGLTQEQVEGIIGLMIETEVEKQSPESIKAGLEKNLTYEEKRSYKANCSLLKQALAGTEEERYINVLTSDPTAVKILGRVINHLKGGKSLNDVRTERETRGAKTQLTGSEAVDQFNKYVSENLGYADKEAKQKELLEKLIKEEDKNYFKEVLGL